MKKKFVIGITVFLLILVAVVGIFLYVRLYPLLQLKDRLDEIISKDYSYSVELTVTGLDKYIDIDELSGAISGTKTNEVLYADVQYGNKSFLELYMDKSYSMIFNLENMFDGYINNMDLEARIAFMAINKLSKGLFVSMDQFEDIIGRNIITITDSGITSDFFSDIVFDKGKGTEYIINKIDSKDVDSSFLGEEAYYFEIELLEKKTTAIVGIPKSNSDKRIYMDILYEDMHWTLNAKYDIKDNVKLDMPKVTFGKEVIAVLKSLYGNLDLLIALKDNFIK